MYKNWTIPHVMFLSIVNDFSLNREWCRRVTQDVNKNFNFWGNISVSSFPFFKSHHQTKWLKCQKERKLEEMAVLILFWLELSLDCAG